MLHIQMSMTEFYFKPDKNLREETLSCLIRSKGIAIN